MRMICENSDECRNSECRHRNIHEKGIACSSACGVSGGILGSKCIPYKEKAVNYRFTEKWVEIYYNDIAQKLPKCNDAYRLFAEFVKASRYIGAREENLQWIVDHPDALKFAIEQGWVERVNTKWDGLFFRKSYHGSIFLVDSKSGKNLIVFRQDGSVKACTNAKGGDGNFNDCGRLIID